MLNCCTLYLTDRKHFITSSGHKSDTTVITHCITQGAVPGPLLFLINPLGQIICQFNLNFHLYADDTQIYKEPATSTYQILSFWN